MTDLVVRFTDAHSVAWTVWEDADLWESSTELTAAPGGSASALVFGSTEGLRRLALTPANWWELPPAELTRLCARAEPIAQNSPTAK